MIKNRNLNGTSKVLCSQLCSESESNCSVIEQTCNTDFKNINLLTLAIVLNDDYESTNAVR